MRTKMYTISLRQRELRSAMMIRRGTARKASPHRRLPGSVSGAGKPWCRQRERARSSGHCPRPSARLPRNQGKAHRKEEAR